MPHHHKKTIVDNYSSSSSDATEGSGDAKTSNSQNHTNTEKSPIVGTMRQSQNNVGMFQTNIQVKEKESCCDCFWSLFFKS